LVIPPVKVNQGIEAGGNVLLVADMIGSRTSVKLLMRLGIALIFAPEPFTTPFGVALVFVARYLARRREAGLNKRLREIVKYYLVHTRCFNDDADGTSTATGLVEHHIQGKEHAILGQITGSPSFEANLASSVWQSWHDMRDRTVHQTVDRQSLSGHYKADDSFSVESGWSDTSSRAEKMIHHTINMKRLTQRYEDEGSAVAQSSLARTSGAGKRVAQHSINMKSLSQRYDTGAVGQAKVKHHTMNTGLLQRRYGSATMYKIALNALKNNNFYYDVVSKGNVIGGY
jgi:hypothetical protein